MFKTGDKTQLGLQKIGLQEIKPKITPIQKEIKKLVMFITIVSIIIGVIFFGFSMLFNLGTINAFIFSVGIIVANVPEGLSLAITVSLSNAAKRLSKQQILVKSLNDVETLGSVSVICSDKTGTLTMNQMTVCAIY